jgi:hypothetical protein
MCNWLEPLFADGIQAGESSEFQTTHNFLNNEYTTTVDGIWDVGLYRDPPNGLPGLQDGQTAGRLRANASTKSSN